LKLEAAKQDDRGSGTAFHRMRAAFDGAWISHPDRRSEAFCTFAGRGARIRVVGQRLSEQMAQAFQHLLTKENHTRVALEIDLWDEGDTSISCPVKSEPINDQQLKANSYIEFGLVFGSLEDRYIGCQRPQMITWLDRSDQHLVGCVSRPDTLALYDRGKPLHFSLLLWHRDQGAEVIHAALVSMHGEGVLFAGKGGAGKSTSALACLEEGFDYLGDDYIALEARCDGSFQGHSLYSSTWFMADDLMNFPRLIPHAIYHEQPKREKTLVPLSRVFPGQLATSARIKALVLPRVTGLASARIRPASKRDALFALAPTSILLLPSSGATALDKLARLTERVPSYWMDVGRNLKEIPDRVQEIIDLARLGRSC